MKQKVFKVKIEEGCTLCAVCFYSKDGQVYVHYMVAESNMKEDDVVEEYHTAIQEVLFEIKVWVKHNGFDLVMY